VKVNAAALSPSIMGYGRTLRLLVAARSRVYGSVGALAATQEREHDHNAAHRERRVKKPPKPAHCRIQSRLKGPGRKRVDPTYPARGRLLTFRERRINSAPKRP
jgi:hypothetical protein